MYMPHSVWMYQRLEAVCQQSSLSSLTANSIHVFVPASNLHSMKEWQTLDQLELGLSLQAERPLQGISNNKNTIKLIVALFINSSLPPSYSSYYIHRCVKLIKGIGSNVKGVLHYRRTEQQFVHPIRTVFSNTLQLLIKLGH